MTFLFSDVEGSTKLFQAHPESYPALLAVHQGLVCGALDAAGGQLVSIEGDGIFYAFSSAQAAVEGATKAQAAMRNYPWNEGSVVRVRMALHTGEAIPVGRGYVSLAVHQAARLGAVGHGGQVLLSETTRDAVPEVAARDLGLFGLKDFEALQHVYQLGEGSFPNLRTTHHGSRGVVVPGTPFVGRTTELGRLASLVREGRLTTLIGPGGSGKSRLAVEAMDGLSHDFPDGVDSVDLTALPLHASRSDIAAQICTALGTLSREEPERAISDQLASLSSLLVLDNCEHVVKELRHLVGALLASSPGLHVLVISRTPLGRSDEVLMRLGELSLPELGSLPEDLMAHDATALFLDRARRSDPGFAISAAVCDDIVAVCRRVDGLPLAIELAASLVSVMPLTDLKRELAASLALIRDDDSVAGERSTLQATIEWSLSLVTDEQRMLWARLGVFEGGFTLAAAREVAAGPGLPAGAVPTALAGLVRASLVAFLPDTRRYRLHAFAREVALGVLTMNNELYDLRMRHLLWLRAYGLSVRAKPMTSERIDLMHHQGDDVLAAFDWCRSERLPLWGGLLGEVWRVLNVRSAETVMDEVMATLPSPADLEGEDGALAAYHSLDFFKPTDPRCEAMFRRALELAPDENSRLLVRIKRAHGVLWQAEPEVAFAEIASVIADPAFTSRDDFRTQEIGFRLLHAMRQDDDESRPALAQALLPVARETDWTGWIELALAELARSALARGDHEEVIRLAWEQFELGRRRIPTITIRCQLNLFRFVRTPEGFQAGIEALTYIARVWPVPSGHIILEILRLMADLEASRLAAQLVGHWFHLVDLDLEYESDIVDVEQIRERLDAELGSQLPTLEALGQTADGRTLVRECLAFVKAAAESS